MRKVANKFCRYRKSVYICEPKRPGGAPRGARAISGGGLRRAKGAEKVPEVLEGKVEGGVSRKKWSDGRVARQRSAKPCTAVRIRFRPHRNRVVDIYNAVFFLFCHTFVIQLYDIPSEALVWLLIDGLTVYYQDRN